MPKSQHFSYEGMLARSQLAALDFNLGSHLEQARAQDGERRYNVSFSKITKSWSAKPIKMKKDCTIFQDMVERAVDAVTQNHELPLPEVPNLPMNIAPVERPAKEEIINRQKSHFPIE